MILIANSGVLENVIFRQTVGSQNYRSCLDMNKNVLFCFAVGDWCYLAVYGEVGGHVILIVLLTMVRKLVSLSVRLFIIILFFIKHF